MSLRRMRLWFCRLCEDSDSRLFTNPPFGLSCHDFTHILGTALLFACVLTVVKSFHWLDGLDALSLRLASTWMSEDDRHGESPQIVPGLGKPLVVAITDELFEREFEQRSPLDRGKLATIIARLTGATWRDAGPAGGDESTGAGWELAKDRALPRVLIVDLDLSPIHPPGRMAEDEKRLDSLIKVLAQKMRIVIMSPLWVVTDEAVEAKSAWMSQLCSSVNATSESADDSPLSGVAFGYSDLVLHGGVLLNQDRFAPTLAALGARRLMQERSKAGQLSPDAQELLDDMKAAWSGKKFATPCSRLAGRKFGFLINPQWKSNPSRIGAVDSDKLFPINWAILGGFDVLRLNRLDDIEKRVAMSSGSESPAVIFLGSDYGTTDRFSTPYGEIAGVYAHATSFGTYFYPTSKTKKWFVFLLDFALGILFGVLFHKTWHKVCQGGEPLQPQLFQLLHLGVLFAGIYLLLVMSGILLIEFRYWLQPAPLLLGTYLDLLHFHFYRDRHDDNHHCQESGADLIAANALFLTKVGLLVGALYSILKDLAK